jgi:hypothetical protein
MMEDEFEFKPLTEGLGFHKKVVDLREDPVPSVAQSTTGILPKPKNPERQSAALMANSSSEKTPAQPARNPAASASGFHPAGARPASTAWKPALEKQTILEKPTAVATNVTTPSPEARPLLLKPVAVSWPASIFDSTMILGLALLFSAVVFAVTRIDLADFFEMLRTDGASQFATALLLLAVLEIYFVACRSFFGKTLGEWAFEYRLGTPAQQSRAAYPLKVAWRALLVAVTGFIVLPLISTFSKRDVTGILTGVSLYSDQQ